MPHTDGETHTHKGDSSTIAWDLWTPLGGGELAQIDGPPVPHRVERHFVHCTEPVVGRQDHLHPSLGRNRYIPRWRFDAFNPRTVGRVMADPFTRRTGARGPQGVIGGSGCRS
jgi:hypothetical protein